MKEIRQLRTGLDELWQSIGQAHWRCAARDRFDRKRARPMLAQMDTLDTLADEIGGLCADAAAAAAAGREPDEEDETWQRD